MASNYERNLEKSTLARQIYGIDNYTPRRKKKKEKIKKKQTRGGWWYNRYSQYHWFQKVLSNQFKKL